MKTGKWTENCGAIAVTLLCAVLVTAAAIHWRHHGSATAIDLVPKIEWSTATFWAAIAYGITGAEFFGMLGARNPFSGTDREARNLAGHNLRRDFLCGADFGVGRAPEAGND